MSMRVARARRVIAGLVLAVLVGCGGTQERGDEADAIQQADLEIGIRQVTSKPRFRATMVFTCDDADSLVTQYDAPTQGLRVFLPSGPVLLPSVPSTATEAHYSNGSIDVWLQGRDLRWESAGSKRSCTLNPRLSNLEDARLRGNHTWAAGNEPGWSLEIGDRFTVLETQYGQTITTLRTPKASVDAGAGTTTYSGRVEDVGVRIVVERGACSDSMSGEVMPLRVTVQVGTDTLHGCGYDLR